MLPVLIRKFHEARQRNEAAAVVWGTGTPRGEFLYVDDLADACLFLMNRYDSDELINVGWGEDVSIRELAQIVREVVGFGGELRFDASKPDGTPRKLLDVSWLKALGWQPSVALREGVLRSYRWFVDHQSSYRG